MLSKTQNSTSPLGGDRDGRVIESDKSRGVDGSAASGGVNSDGDLNPNGMDSGKATKNGDSRNGDSLNGDDEDDFDIGKLLYIIPIAIICVLLVIFIIVIIFTR